LPAAPSFLRGSEPDPGCWSKLREMDRLKKGDRVALLGIGSGLNCSMAEVVW
jgi:3-oxoacyl-[acyl-carrier-protein] synthase III